MRHFCLLLFFIFSILLFSQVDAQNAVIRGRLKEDTNQPIARVKVTVAGNLSVQTLSDTMGYFSLELPAGTHILTFSHVNFDTAKRVIELRKAATELMYIVMKQKDVAIEEQVIRDERDLTGLPGYENPMFQIMPIDLKKVTEIPSPKADLESKIVTLPGVAANNEFSSQYRVRGGNFDENLIYVNDIEIYRPFLIRSGQQEGLGFINPNLASEVAFSTGGFNPRYADKLSSVLDVTYKTPESFHGTAELGILTQNFHLEGRSKKGPEEKPKSTFTYLVGARRFSTTYLLGTLDTQGEYKPSFYDVQTYLTWVPKVKDTPTFKVKERKGGSLDTVYIPQNKWKISFLGNLAKNHYYFEPSNRETQFGTVQKVLRLRVAFVGAELTDYLTGLGAFMAEYRPNVRLRNKLIITGFSTKESEEFDVEGGYWLSDVNSNYGNEGFNEVVFDRGIGSFYRRARNYLYGRVLALEDRAEWFPSKSLRHKLNFGFRVQSQFIEDEINEWNGTDSAGYFSLKEVIKTRNTFSSVLAKVYIEDNWKLDAKGILRLVGGSRAVYNSLNNQLFISPRLNIVFNPSAKVSNPATLSPEELQRYERRKYQLRLAVGLYHQPPFYREMRVRDGTVFTDTKAQSSFHVIAGVDYQFKVWRRPFKIYGEAYYKYLNNLIPYEIDNVRIRYYPQNIGVGYAYGLDVRLNGEFIKDVDSWMSLSLLKTMENVSGDTLGFVPRPTDQRFSFAMFFQDELPMNPTYKVHLNIVYGSGLRIGPPGVLENRTVFKAPAYQRVDLGFSKMFLFKTQIERGDKIGMESLWISLEIFNLFQRANTVSYTWIKDIFNDQFGVPNYLSSRLLNLRLIARF